MKMGYPEPSQYAKRQVVDGMETKAVPAWRQYQEKKERDDLITKLVASMQFNAPFGRQVIQPGQRPPGGPGGGPPGGGPPDEPDLLSPTTVSSEQPDVFTTPTEEAATEETPLSEQIEEMNRQANRLLEEEMYFTRLDFGVNPNPNTAFEKIINKISSESNMSYEDTLQEAYGKLAEANFNLENITLDAVKYLTRLRLDALSSERINIQDKIRGMSGQEEIRKEETSPTGRASPKSMSEQAEETANRYEDIPLDPKDMPRPVYSKPRPKPTPIDTKQARRTDRQTLDAQILIQEKIIDKMLAKIGSSETGQDISKWQERIFNAQDEIKRLKERKEELKSSSSSVSSMSLDSPPSSGDFFKSRAKIPSPKKRSPRARKK
jgi:hypothetical protein